MESVGKSMLLKWDLQLHYIFFIHEIAEKQDISSGWGGGGERESKPSLCLLMF